VIVAKELYVGHLPYETTEQDLRRIFAVAGTVTSVHIITDPDSGRSKGCAYVRMASVESMKDAIESLDGAMIEGRLITVSEAKPQKQLVQARPGGKRRPGQNVTRGKGRRQ
jgi:RNA recognition motif-containing protein